MANHVLAGLVNGNDDIAADVFGAAAEPGRFGDRVANQLQPVRLRRDGQAQQGFGFIVVRRGSRFLFGRLFFFSVLSRGMSQPVVDSQ